MKRLVILSAAITLLAALSACGSTANSNSQSSSSETSTAAVTDAAETTEPDTSEEANAEPVTEIGEDSSVVLEVSNHCVLISNSSAPVFSVALSQEIADGCGNIGLFDESGNQVASLLDDGNDCDHKAGDLIYSAGFMYNLRGVHKFTAKSDNFETNSVTVSYIDEITDEDIAEMDKLTAEIGESVNSLKDKDGNVPHEKAGEAYDLVIECVKKLYDEGKVVEYHRNPDNVEIKFAMGVTYIYEVKDPLCD